VTPGVGAQGEGRQVEAGRRWSDLLPRVISGVVLVAAALATVFWGGSAFAVFWLLASAAVLWEWQHMVGGARLSLRVTVGAAALAIAAGLSSAGLAPAAAAVAVLGTLGVALAAPAGFRLIAAAGAIYSGALILSAILLRSSFPGGLESILWLFAVVWGTDIMAYFGGRLIGGPKLWPRLSPAKTWSGFLVGVLSGALAGLLVKPIEAAALPCVVIGLAAGAVSQGGDLFESWLKRRYGVKDASHLIPGHGGAMDRLDGFVAAATFSAVVGTLHAGLPAAGFGLLNW
jgi:phosphatidate cytidylyltransferase